jgi:hypothetical protein
MKDDEIFYHMRMDNFINLSSANIWIISFCHFDESNHLLNEIGLISIKHLLFILFAYKSYF